MALLSVTYVAGRLASNFTASGGANQRQLEMKSTCVRMSKHKFISVM